MKKVFKITLYIVLAILTLISLSLMIKKFIFKEDIPTIMGFGCLQVATGSMEPTYKIDDIIMIKKTSEFEVGDVIVYKEQDYYVTHRLIEKQGDYFITKGDANNTSERFPKENAIAKVVYRSNFASFLINVLRNPVILILIGAIVVLINKLGGKNGEEGNKEKI